MGGMRVRRLGWIAVLLFAGCSALAPPPPPPAACDGELIAHDTKRFSSRMAMVRLDGLDLPSKRSPVAAIDGISSIIGDVLGPALSFGLRTLAGRFEASEAATQQVEFKKLRRLSPGGTTLHTTEISDDSLIAVVRTVEIPSTSIVDRERELFRFSDETELAKLLTFGVQADSSLAPLISSGQIASMAKELADQLLPAAGNRERYVTFAAIWALHRSAPGHGSSGTGRRTFVAYPVTTFYPALMAAAGPGAPIRTVRTKSALSIDMRGPQGDLTYQGGRYQVGATWGIECGVPKSTSNLKERWRLVHSVASPPKNAPRFAAPGARDIAITITLAETSRMAELLRKAADEVKDL